MKFKNDNLTLVYREEAFSMYEYKPKFTKLFEINLEPLTIQKWVRFQLELLKGYRVYYMVVKDQVVGSCVVSRGGGRYSFADKKDIVVGPYFVCEEHRGHGYAGSMVDVVLNKLNIDYVYAWDWIRKDNYPSIKSTERNGFKKVYEANVSKITKRITLCKNGAFLIYRKKKH